MDRGLHHAHRGAPARADSVAPVTGPALTVELGGYTDPRGALDYNYALSQRRVDAVRRFLMDKGIQLARIQAASLGPISGTDVPDAKKRRVTVRLMVDQE